MASSAEIQDTLVYGYIYPEINAHPNTTPAQLAELVHDDVDRLYGGSNLMEAFQAPTDEEKLSKAMAALEIVSSGSQEAISSPKISAQSICSTKTKPGDPYDLNPDTYQEWIVNVAIDKSALGGSARVLFFLGADSPEDPKEWADHPSYIGVYDLFAPEDPEECQNCSELQETGYKVGGTVFLTKELILRGIALVGDQPENYLKENLQVRGFGLSTQQVYTPQTLPSLELSIQSAGYETTPGIGAPGRARRKEWQIHRGVTGGRLNEAPASEA
jgi:hypothetical protein